MPNLDANGLMGLVVGLINNAGGGGGGGGTSNYNELSNKPKIGGVTLSGNKSLSTLGIASEEAVEELTEAIANQPDLDDSTKTGVDLDVSDEDGNVLLRMKDGHIQTKNFSSAKVSPNIVTLKTFGGDFSTLKAAIESITDADPETNPYEIHVYPGVYDTLSGFTEEEIQSADIGGGYTDQSMVGCKLTDGMSIIGIGDRDSIILTAELDTTNYSSAVRGNISTLNLKGTCRVENLTIKAKRIRYCVHDDFTFNKRYQRIVKNCRFVAVGTFGLSYNPATTYGSGIREAGCDALFENCDFGYNFGMHTRSNMTNGSNVVLRNCVGLCAKINDSANEADTAKNTFVFDSCGFKGISLGLQSATTPHIEVFGVNNPNTMVFCSSAFHPHIADTIKTRASNIPVGTFVNVTEGGITASSNGIDATVASSVDGAMGVIVDRDTEYDYIQQTGYINGTLLGLSGLSVGDYVTVDGNMKLTGGGTASNAVGVVKYKDSNNVQIWLM